MPCYHPNVGVRYLNQKIVKKDGEIGERVDWISRHKIKKDIRYDDKLPINQQPFLLKGFQDTEIFPIACHNCIGCRIYRSCQWGLRCMHEAQMHQDNSFLTLTYAPEYEPKDGKLVKDDMQKFFKRLRFQLDKQNIKVRYLYCGEYGGQTKRPHYHAILFGYDFPDKTPFKKNHMGQYLFISEELTRIWGKGHCLIGGVDYASACYVARYCIDKINGEEAKLHYAISDEEGNPLVDEDGIIQMRPSEFAHMSNGKLTDLGGGIGVKWFEQYHTDLYPLDECVLEGRKYPVPVYYDKLLKKFNRELYDSVKATRKENSVYASLEKPLEQSEFYLMQKQAVKMAQREQLVRTLYN